MDIIFLGNVTDCLSILNNCHYHFQLFFRAELSSFSSHKVSSFCYYTPY
nr:MAG TPA: hypothetical protein [Caudoviricetes sp.]